MMIIIEVIFVHKLSIDELYMMETDAIRRLKYATDNYWPNIWH
jgi:hypothetical protein